MHTLDLPRMMLRLDRVEWRPDLTQAAPEWLAILEEGFPGCQFALICRPPDADERQVLRVDAPPLALRNAEPDVLRDAIEGVLTSGAATMVAIGGGSEPGKASAPWLPREARSANLFALDRHIPRGILVAASQAADGLAPALRQPLALLADKLGHFLRQAETFASLSATCNDLERKCSLRMTALKKTVQKLESEIRERKRVAAALAEKEEQFKAIADYTYGWESWIGEDGRLLWVNPMVEQLTGYAPQACFAMERFPLDIIAAEDRLRIADLLAKALARRTSGTDVEFRIRHQNGSAKWMALSWQPIYNDQQAFMGFRTSIRDISQRKAAEEKLQRSHDRLEEEVANRTASVRALQKRLQAENLFLKRELAETAVYGEIIGESPSIKTVISRIELVAPTQANVLILGESGTGKELVAREIHRHSRLQDRPFIPVNCATIPRDLYESEFFGHVKGAFTGAVRDRIGRFEAADGGTIFLDEVGEIPLPLQGKLLRVLQDGEFERVGEGLTRRVQVRIIAATNIQLREAVRKKRFREDLYYRLNVFPIEMTPLRRRKRDLPLLAAHFLERFAKRMNRPTPKLSKANLMDLQAYDWPGNVRELQNLIERALILSPVGRLRFDLPTADRTLFTPPDSRTPLPGGDADPPVMKEEDIKAFQRRNIVAALKQSGGKIYGKKGAAERLGIKPTTLTERIKAMGIEKPV